MVATTTQVRTHNQVTIITQATMTTTIMVATPTQVTMVVNQATPTGNNTETTVNSHNNAQNNKQALSQTGNTKNAAAVVGLGLASLTALFGLGGRKKKEN